MLRARPDRARTPPSCSRTSVVVIARPVRSRDSIDGRRCEAWRTTRPAYTLSVWSVSMYGHRRLAPGPPRVTRRCLLLSGSSGSALSTTERELRLRAVYYCAAELRRRPACAHGELITRHCATTQARHYSATGARVLSGAPRPAPHQEAQHGPALHAQECRTARVAPRTIWRLRRSHTDFTRACCLGPEATHRTVT